MFAVVSFVGMTSCKKDFECECKNTDGELVTHISASGTASKKEAKDICNGLSAAGHYTCEVK